MTIYIPSLFVYRQQYLVIAVCLSLFLTDQAVAKSNVFQINNLNIAVLEDELRLDAEIDYQLNEEVKEALVNGVSMLFQLEVQIKSLRKWPWKKTVSSITRTHLLKYHALSKQYIWENLENSVSHTFPDLNSALIHQGRITAMYIAETSTLNHKYKHMVRLRSRLLTNKLPLPFRVKSYFSPKWQLTSGWYEWPL